MRPVLQAELQDTATKVREMREAHKKLNAEFPPMKNNSILRVLRGESLTPPPMWMMR